MPRGRGRDTADQERGRGSSDLRAELGQRDLSRHLALFYESRGTQLESATEYLDHGLQSDHRCLYLADSNTTEQVKKALRASNIEVDRRVQAGDLVIRDASEVYLDAGFSPDQVITAFEAECRASVTDGYDGLWVAGENTWCFHAQTSFDQILDFEADFDAVCPDLPVTALCQYDLADFEETSAAKALWTHEQVIYQNTLCENPFYIPPEDYRRTADPHLNAKLMLEQTYNLSHARQQVNQREQRLAVVNRILRHNVRNQLNVVRGALERLETSVDSDENLRNSALKSTENILEIAEKARYIQQTIADPTMEPVSLESVLEQAVRDVRAAYPGAEVTISGDQNITVLTDTNLDIAISEALTQGMGDPENNSATAMLTISTPSPTLARIEVAGSDAIPEMERQALQRGYETPLEHVRGLGLWLIVWVVENSNGTVQFLDAKGDETKIRIDLQRA